MVISVEGKKEKNSYYFHIFNYDLLISLYFFSGWDLKGAEIYNKQE